MEEVGEVGGEAGRVVVVVVGVISTWFGDCGGRKNVWRAEGGFTLVGFTSLLRDFMLGDTGFLAV